MNNLGLTQWFVSHSSNPNLTAFIKELGFGYLHINAGIPSDPYYIGKLETQRLYLNAIDQYDVCVSAISVDVIENQGFLVNERLTIDPYLQTIIENVINAAYRLNVPLVYFPSFNLSRIKNSTDLNMMIKILQFACDFSAQYKIDIATENTLSAAGNLILLNKANRPNLKLLLDTLNPILWGHSVTAFIDNLYPYITSQIHVKDGVDKQMGSLRLGQGDAKLETTLTALFNKGFDGSFIFENNYLEKNELLIKEDLCLFNNMISKIKNKQLTC